MLSPASTTSHLLPTQTDKCEIPAQSGAFIGACQSAAYIERRISFCKSRVCYDACVPPVQYLDPSWTVTAKDLLVEKFYKALVEERIRKEVNVVRMSKLTNPARERGTRGHQDRRGARSYVIANWSGGRRQRVVISLC